MKYKPRRDCDNMQNYKQFPKRKKTYVLIKKKDKQNLKKLIYFMYNNKLRYSIKKMEA